MAMMTAQPPLPLAPDSAPGMGAAAAMVEDSDGGRVYVHGNLGRLAPGDTAGRRLAAVLLVESRPPPSSRWPRHSR